MAIITISRQFASGGSSIAKLVGERMGWQVIDNDFIDRVAARAGMTAAEVEAQEERVPTIIERLADALAISSPELFVATGEPPDARLGHEERVVRATEMVITQLVREKPNVIMVGRGAQACLADLADTLHVYVVAPREKRTAAASRRLSLSPDEASDRVDTMDEGRRRYVRTHYGRRWDDPANYHLVINTGVFSYEASAELIVDAARLKGWL